MALASNERRCWGQRGRVQGSLERRRAQRRRDGRLAVRGSRGAASKPNRDRDDELAQVERLLAVGDREHADGVLERVDDGLALRQWLQDILGREIVVREERGHRARETRFGCRQRERGVRRRGRGGRAGPDDDRGGASGGTLLGGTFDIARRGYGIRSRLQGRRPLRSRRETCEHLGMVSGPRWLDTVLAVPAIGVSTHSWLAFSC